MSPYHQPPFPTSDGLPSRGLFCPLQDPSFAIPRLAPRVCDERPVRLRGSVSVPTLPAPASAIAAPLSDSRCGEASGSGVRVSPVSPRCRDPARLDPASTANAALVGRHVLRGQAALSLTPGGHCTLFRARVESMSPSRSTGLSVAAFRWPEGIGAARAPRLITA